MPRHLIVALALLTPACSGLADLDGPGAPAVQAYVNEDSPITSEEDSVSIGHDLFLFEETETDAIESRLRNGSTTHAIGVGETF